VAASQDSEGDPSESEAPSEAAAGAGFMSERQAAVELFLRLNHARQTVDFVKRQARAALCLCCLGACTHRTCFSAAVQVLRQHTHCE
jgi:hypothetical protein